MMQKFGWAIVVLVTFGVGSQCDATQLQVADSFGRDVTNKVVRLSDWQGHLMNPMTQLTLIPPETARYPLNVSIRAFGSSRLMLDRPSRTTDRGALKDIQFENASSRIELKLAIAPDREGGFGEIEKYELQFEFEDGLQTIPIEVIDLDDDLEPKWPLVFDYRPDTLTDLFDKPGFKESSELAMKDWFYFFKYRKLDTVPAGAELASIPGTDWKSHEDFANDKPFNGFWIFKRTHKGPYATGFPNNPGKNYHTRKGAVVPGLLPRSGTLVMHDNPEAVWNISAGGEVWYRTDPHKIVDVYGLTMHEFGHAIVFSHYLPGFKMYSERPQEAKKVVAYQGKPVAVDKSAHLASSADDWDRLSGHSGGYGGVFPPRRWMLTKLVLLVAEAVGWELRDIGPFIKAQIVTRNLASGVVGGNYQQQLKSNFGGVPVYDWQIVKGNLPQGLSLDRFTGQISGKITAEEGRYRFTVQLKDDDSLSKCSTKSLSINVRAKKTPGTNDTGIVSGTD